MATLLTATPLMAALLVATLLMATLPMPSLTMPSLTMPSLNMPTLDIPSFNTPTSNMLSPKFLRLKIQRPNTLSLKTSSSLIQTKTSPNLDDNKSASYPTYRRHGIVLLRVTSKVAVTGETKTVYHYFLPPTAPSNMLRGKTMIPSILRQRDRTVMAALWEAQTCSSAEMKSTQT
jgi:hypothetical protein